MLTTNLIIHFDLQL